MQNVEGIVQLRRTKKLSAVCRPSLTPGGRPGARTGQQILRHSTARIAFLLSSAVYSLHTLYALASAKNNIMEGGDLELVHKLRKGGDGQP
jgi:hypothetical protein